MSALYVEFSTDPDKAEEAATLAQAVVEQFAAEGPTAAEMETMRKQVRNSLETALQEPGFWVELLSDLDYHHNNLEDVDGLIDKLMAFSRADISAVLQQMLVPEHFATVLARPKAPLASSQQTPLQPELPDSSLQ
jgi:predicted Zn-dependent peptidase